MKLKRLMLAVSVLLVMLCAGSTAYAQRFEFPPPDGYVNDFADILSDETEDELEARLEKFDKDESTQILVITVDELPENATLEMFVPELTDDYPEWRAGTEEFDNGVIFTIVVDNREMRIDTGYGVEGALPDGQARLILDYEVQPMFKEGDYDVGVTAGVAAIMQEVTGEYSTEQVSDGDVSVGGGVPGIFFICFPLALLIGLPYIAAFLGRTKSWWLGGIVGFAGGLIMAGVVSFFFRSLVTGAGSFILCPPVFAILGLIFDFILSRNYKVRRKRRLPTGWTRSFGGFSSGGGIGGGFSGGGGSSGGFRAGGGSFGGGGASSGW